MYKESKLLIVSSKDMFVASMVRMLELCGFNSIKTLNPKSTYQVEGDFSPFAKPSEIILIEGRLPQTLVNSLILKKPRRILSIVPFNRIYRSQSVKYIYPPFSKNSSDIEVITAAIGDIYGSESNSSRTLIDDLIHRIYKGKGENAKKISINHAEDQVYNFLFVDDLVRACILLLDTPLEELERLSGKNMIEITYEKQYSIKDLTFQIAKILNYQGQFIFLKPPKLEAVLTHNHSLKQLGWKPSTTLLNGLTHMCNWYLTHQNQFELFGERRS